MKRHENSANPIGRPRKDLNEPFTRGLIVKGQSVTINYPAEFEKEYPNTYRLFNGQSGLVESFLYGAGENLVGVRLAFRSDMVTLVDRHHIVRTGM